MFSRTSMLINYLGWIIMPKTNTCLLRLSDQENDLISFKSKLLGVNKSKLFRQSALAYWSDSFDGQAILELYQQGDDETKKSLVSTIAAYFRKKGYPYTELSSNQLKREMQKISNTKCPLLDDNHLQMNTVGLALANYFHPHMVKVKCLKNYRSPYEQFEDDELFKDAINRWMELGKRPDPSGLRRILRTRDGVRSVVNFKPAIAKYFYDTYCPKGGKVLDPCAGYSGRLAGCISTNKDISYHGIDPDGRTATGNMRMAGFFMRQYDICDREYRFSFRFDLGCAEDIMPSLNDCYDLIWTSPPYWNIEKYSDCPNQSYLRYPEYEVWRDNFLRDILYESVRVIKDGGYIIYNVKNYKRAPIADDLCSIAEELGLTLVKTYQMRVSNSEFHHKGGEPTWHTEPIFVFRK